MSQHQGWGVGPIEVGTMSQVLMDFYFDGFPYAIKVFSILATPLSSYVNFLLIETFTWTKVSEFIKIFQGVLMEVISCKGYFQWKPSLKVFILLLCRTISQLIWMTAWVLFWKKRIHICQLPMIKISMGPTGAE